MGSVAGPIPGGRHLVHSVVRGYVVSLEYDALAVGIKDNEDGSKTIVVATKCHRTVRINMSRSQGRFVTEIDPVQEPA